MIALPVPFPVELEHAAAELRAASTELKKLRAAAYEAERAFREAKEKFQSSQLDLQRTESAAAVGESAHTGNARKAFLAGRDAMDFAGARVVGIQPRLDAAKQAEEAARTKVTQAWVTYSAAVIADFQFEYHAAVMQFFSVLDKGLAIGYALTGYPEAERLINRIKGQQILGLHNDPKEYFRESHRVWNQSPAAVQFHDLLAAERKRLFLGAEKAAE